MTSVVLPIAAGLWGFGLLHLLRARLTAPALLGAALVLGPTFLTLAFYIALSAGIPHGPTLAWLLAGTGLPLALLSPRSPDAGRLPLRSWIGPALIALCTGVLLIFLILHVPTPDGDGLFNFALKARGIHALGEFQPLLKHPRMAIVHPDYPLHQPLLMDLGYLLAGSTGGLHALLGGVLVIPGLILLLGSLAAKRGTLAGIVTALLVALIPACRSFGTAGYADIPLMAVFATAGVLTLAPLAPRRSAEPGLAAAAAAGLLPWIKLEGIFLLGLLLLGAAASGLARRRLPWKFLVAALVLGAVWPASLAILGLGLPASELSDAQSSGAHAALLARAFGGLLVDPDNSFALAWPPVILACLLAVAARGRPTLRAAGCIVLLAILLYPLLAWLRNTAPEHLTHGDVPTRLYLHVLPLGLYVLCSELIPVRTGMEVKP